MAAVQTDGRAQHSMRAQPPAGHRRNYVARHPDNRPPRYPRNWNLWVFINIVTFVGTGSSTGPAKSRKWKKTIQACRSPDIGSWSWKSPDFLSWCDVVRSVCYFLHWLLREMSYVQLHCTAGVGRVIADAHVGLCVSVLRYRMSLSRHAATEPYHSTEPQQMSQQQQSTGRPLPNNTRPRRLPKVNNRDDETTPRYHHGNSRPATNDQ